MPFLSVIIPVYNVEAYLRQCVDSVLNQKLDDYELILVDDGSPDSCPQICDEYATHFPQIRVIHQKNGGLSAARNAGLNAATGQYVMFMDSDDWWNPDVSVSNMLEEIKQNPDVDIFLFAGLDYVEGEGFFERGDSIRRLGRKRFYAAEYYETMLAMGNLQVSAATKVLSAAFLRQHELCFMPGIKGEDNEWMIRLLRYNPVIITLPELLYICRMGRQGSITNTIGKKNVSDLLQIVNNSIEHYSKQGAEQMLMEYEYCFCAYLWFCALGLSYNLSKTERVSLVPQFNQTAGVCPYSNSRKTKIAYSVYRICGFKITANVLGSFIRMKSKLKLHKKKAL